MASPAGPQIWVKCMTYVLIAFVIMVLQLVPQSMEPHILTIALPGDMFAPWRLRIVPPDLCLAVTIVWVVRRPKFIPVWIIAGIFLLSDLVFQRPPGLWAGMVVWLTEELRKRHRDFRAMPFLGEWSSVALGMFALFATYRLVLAIFALNVPPLGMVLLQLILTIAVYPFVAVFMHYVFGITRVAPGETGSRGQRV
ncbi:rod shape-determining protein MreD [Yoonia sp. I 8.24]|nr:rod shape-determining protein MreD [Yoonia sp. I 8.24]